MNNGRAQRFIRIGNVPPGGRSLNWITGDSETGVSAYVMHGHTPVVPSGDAERNTGLGTGEALRGRLCRTLRNRALPEPLHALTGDVAARGAEGEPLLRNVRITGAARVIYVAPKGKHNHYVQLPG